ncbi:MAG: MoaD/ThiS family protein [Thermoproteota archaeon]|jgi:molybdopterin converting factor small subunit|nr:MoaD/ThiS family protein [Thermoproteota archaeon]
MDLQKNILKVMVKVKFLGVLKGLAKTSEVDLEIDKHEITLKELISLLSNKFGEEFRNRVFQGDKISPDLLVNYENKVFPARLNEYLMIKGNTTITLFSFVHGG